MNTNGPAKYYDILTPRERLPLIMAASARGDETERLRLMHSAPKNCWRLPDYHGMGEGIELLALLQLIQVLDLAVHYWKLSGILESSPLLFKGRKLNEKQKRYCGTMRLLAYLIVINGDAWRQFCGELSIDPEILLMGKPGYGTVKAAEKDARVMAFSAEEAAQWARRRGNDKAEVVTVTDVVDNLRAALNERARHWE